MRLTKTGIACKVFALLFLPLFALAQERYTKVKIYAPKDSYQRAELMGLLEIDHFLPAGKGAIVSEISAHCLLKLKSSPYAYEILVPDVAKRLDSLNKIYYRSVSRSRVAIEQPGTAVSAIIQTPVAFQVKATLGGYYSYAEMVTAIDNLVGMYPTIAQKINIGTTSEGRTLWLVKISDNVATDEANEPEVLYLGLQHAREAITGSSMIFFMQYLCERYAANDSKIVNLVNNREIYIVPCFNPDGWEYNRTSMSGAAGGGWRKNRDPNGGGTYGTDLNRNWGVDWANCSAPISGPASSCGSSTTSSDTYWGTAAFSEAETQAIRNFTKTHHIVAGFDQHAYGPYYSLPFGRKELHTMPLKGQNFYTAIPALMGTYNGMRAADSYDALGYEVAGGFKDWMLMGEIGVGTKDTVWAMTGEGAAGGGTPAFGSYADFWAPASEIVNLSRSMCYQNLQLAFAAGTYVDITDATDMAIATKTGTFTCNIKRIGLANDPVTITLVPIQNMSGAGSPVVINSMNYYDSLNVNITYTLPAAIANGQRVKFAWQVNTGGYTYSDTVIKLFNATSLLYDNMEGSLTTNWTNTTSTGTFASGFGYNYTGANWQFTTAGYKSTQALSESANGINYTGSSIRTIQYNSTFDLSNATSAYLTFWARYRAENFRDKVQVQVSINGTTWTAIRGTHTIEEPGTLDDATINGQPALTGIHDYWMRETFDLSAYNGQAALRLRFVFTSDNDPSSFAFERDEGFFIDNLSVMKTTVPLVVLPVNFLSFTGILLPNNTVKLDWQASTDQGHDYFLVERSSDDKNFITLGQVTQSSPYSFVDLSPLDGKNFYRIKQMNKNGSFTYSNVISFNIGKRNLVYAYPNPVSDVLSIRLKNPESDRIKIEITDVNGKMFYNCTSIVDENTAELKVDMSSIKRQVYILRVSNSKGEVISTQKVVKL